MHTQFSTTINRRKESSQSKFSIVVFFITLVLSSSIILLSYFSDYDESTSISLALVAFGIYVVGCGSAVSWNLLHPFVWYNLTFLLYSASAPIRSFIGEDPYELQTHSEALQLQFWSLVSFCFGLGVYQPEISREPSENWATVTKGLKLFTLVSFLIGSLYLLFVFTSGIESKQEKVFFGAFSRIDFIFTFLNTAITVRLINLLCSKSYKQFVLLACFAIAYLILAFSIIGERSVIFRFLVVLIFIYHVFGRKIPLFILIVVGSILVYLSSLMAYLKGFLLSSAKLDELDLTFEWRNVLEFALSSEFRTAGENLAILLQYVPHSIPFFYGKALWWEIQSILSLGLFRARDQNENAAYWFVREFFPAVYEEGSGMGFSLVAQGYLDFGYIGAILLFFGLGLLTKKIYSNAGKNLLYFVFYVNYAPILMVASRQQVGAVISQSLKHVLFPILIMLFIGKLLSKTRTR